ncbi:two pore domain potassium channel family protein [Billgrantia pellis]|uniref:Two pore domain potassium channel family protein n=1 Tax=Billgrantia pellis TaxID=2606936 RepID=A0A7V7KJA1_9GAMM|nr:potassium channel family protein [Halomonas pellis]KAA0013852.1 two pore domain potassium channel family protein [Halomonas pellis]
MSLFIALSGFLLVGLVVFDAVQTTLTGSKSGPITRLLCQLAWYPALRLHRRYRLHGLLASMGPWSTVALITVWLGLVWLGWWLVFNSQPQAVFHPDSGTFANPTERLYFIGYTITTLGYGDFVPGGAKWQVFAVMAAASGFFLLTLAVTYFLSIVSAVVQKRQLAISVHALGDTPEAIVRHLGEEEDFAELASQVDDLKSTIIRLGQQHLAYPVLHYYHEVRPDRALPVALCKLYQALTIVLHASPSLAPSVRFKLTTTLSALESFLAVLDRNFVSRSDQLPMIEPAWLPRHPTFSRNPTEIRRYLEGLDSQRVWHAYIEKDGWRWETVWQGSSDQAER